MNCDLELPQVLPSETFYDTVCEEFMYVNWYLVILGLYTIMVIKESTQLVSKIKTKCRYYMHNHCLVGIH